MDRSIKKTYTDISIEYIYLFLPPHTVEMKLTQFYHSKLSP